MVAPTKGFFDRLRKREASASPFMMPVTGLDYIKVATSF